MSNSAEWLPLVVCVATISAGVPIQLGTGDASHVQSPALRSLSGHSGPVRSVAFSPDGKTLASSGEDGSIRLWNVQTGALETTLAIKDYIPPIRSIVFAPGGRSLLAGDANGNVLRWDISSGKPDRVPMTGSFFGVSDSIRQIAISPDGKKLVVDTVRSGSGDRWGGDRIAIWDAATLAEERVLCGHDDMGGRPVFNAAFSPDGDVVAAGFTGQAGAESDILVWNARSGRQLVSIGDSSTRGNSLLAFSPNGSTAAIAFTDAIAQVDINQVVRTGWWEEKPGWYGAGVVPPHRAAWGVPDNKVTAMLYSPDGRTIASVGGLNKGELYGRRLRLRDAESGQLKMEWPEGGQIDCLAYSPDGRTLAGACEDGAVRLWDTSRLVAVAAPKFSMEPPLIRDLARGDRREAKEIIEAGGDVRVHSQTGTPAILMAAQYGYIEVVKALAAKGADPRETDEDGVTALMLTASEGHTEVVDYLLKAGLDINGKANDGWTALMWTAYSGHQSTLEFLLDKGADVYARTKDRVTALMWAAQAGEDGNVKALLAHRADTEAASNLGLTALLLACAQGHDEVVRLLLDHHADSRAKSKDGATALLFAAQEGHTRTVRLLLQRGLNVNECSPDSFTALRCAVEHGHPDVVSALLEAGADPNIAAKDGYTPLMMACFAGRADLAKLLLAKKANPRAVAKDGSTALSLAQKKGATEAEALVRAALGG